jgi:tetratricopeptide (TPR) repeat protein
LPYLTARKNAQARFEAGDYPAAANSYEQALKLDPFAMNAVLQGVNSYLLQDHLPEAIVLLKAMRLRGTSEAVQTADLMLKQLAAVSPEAATEVQSGVPQPPPIEEVFSGMHFGVPDWDAGKRHLETAEVDITRWTKDLKMEVPMPVLVASAATATPARAAETTAQATAETAADHADDAQAAAVNNAIFHVEVVPTGDTRNLRLRPDATEEFGYVQFDGPAGETPVVFAGKQVVLPTKLKLPTGKYEIRTVDEGKVVNRQDLEVTPLSTQTFKVKRP